MASNLDFDRLDPIPLEETIACLQTHPDPLEEDIAFSKELNAMMDDEIGGMDWVGGCQSLDAEPLNNGNGSESGYYLKPIAMNCTWSGCDYLSAAATDLTIHLESHGQQALLLFLLNSRCFWQGCTSKAIFKTVKPYEHHLKNIHTHPLLCTVRKCTHKKPFRNTTDLDRHIDTVHSDKRDFECPYATCEVEPNTFARKDKWINHIRETQHQDDAFCPFFHCDRERNSTFTGFTSRNEIARHLREHAFNQAEGYECALGSCGLYAHRDFWKYTGLVTHLSTHHSVEDPQIFYWMWEGRLLTADHFHCLNENRKWNDCTICSQLPTQSQQNPQMYTQVDL